jgi:carboxymethylenebutenolidase
MRKTDLSNDEGISCRREFLRKMTIYGGGLAVVSAFSLQTEESSATSFFQETTRNSFVSYPGEKGDVRAYLSMPSTGSRFPAVIVIHENRGLVPHIMDVTRRMAAEGFLALAPDALSPMGGTPEGDETKSMEMMRNIDNDLTTKNFIAAVKYLETHPNSNGNVGCTGFCWGGAMTNQVAVGAPTLDAAVPYYGRQPSAEQVKQIKCPILAHYAENDEGIDAGIAAFEQALKDAGIEYHIYIYPGTQHAFNNDTNPQRYNAEAAKLAWSRTISFFKEKLT